MSTRLSAAKPRVRYPHIEVNSHDVVRELQRFAVDIDMNQRDIASAALEIVLDDANLRFRVADKLKKEK